MALVRKLDNKWTFMLALIWLGVVVAQMVSSGSVEPYCMQQAYDLDTSAAHVTVVATE